MNKVFVYGTLKRGCSNHHLLENSNFLGESLVGGFDLFDLGYYPCVAENPLNKTPVKGEVFEVNEHVMERLDRLEGYPHHYNRKLVGTDCGDAYIYFYEKPPLRGQLLANGEWK